MDSSELLQALITSTTDHAIVVTDRSGRVALWNAGAERIFGVPTDEALGADVRELTFTESDRLSGMPEREMRLARLYGHADDIRWHRRRDGSVFWADGTLTPIRGRKGAVTGYVKIVRDSTERKRYEDEISRRARIDALTGLSNRADLATRLPDMMAAAHRHRRLLILLLIDLDHFKVVNDRLGHHAGDTLLQQAAERMRSVVRETDIVARLGGDEFVVLQSDAQSPEAGGALADKLVEVLSLPFDLDGEEVQVGASVGIAVFPQDAAEPEQLMRKADLALYEVKSTTRNGYRYFTGYLDDSAHRRSHDQAELRRAVRDRTFAMHYQPQIDCVTGRVIAVEALLRCTSPPLSRLQIGEVILLASELGLMRELGLWALSAACDQMRQWREAGLPPVRLCVNFCPAELTNPQLASVINVILERNGLTAADLEIEVTERQLLDAHSEGSYALADLRSKGLSVTIDDFGTGYSSLSYLSHLPVDRIKLDRLFVHQIPNDMHSCAVASAIIGLAHTLNLQIVIEGVESAEQAEFFHNKGCEALQGYYFSPPLAAEDMAHWLRDIGTSPTAQVH